MPQVAIAGGEIHYEEMGKGHPLIFVSGLGGVARYWQPQMAAFAKHFRVVAYDHRGTGASDRKQRKFAIDQMATETLSLMDALKIERAHLVGHSTGGAIGQTIAIEQPQRLARLVLSSTWTHCDSFFRRLFESRQQMLRKGGAELHALFHPLWLYPPWWINSHDTEIREEQKKALENPSPVEVSIARIDALLAFDRRAGLARIKTPTLVMGSDNDCITPAYFSQAIARAIPGAKLVIERDAGHAASKTRSAEFNRAVLEFLGAAG